MRNFFSGSLTLCLASFCPSAFAIEVNDVQQSQVPTTLQELARTGTLAPLRVPELTHSVSQKFSQAKLKIRNVKVQGNCLITADDILREVKIKEGDPYSRDRVTDDLKAISHLGFFEQLHCIPIQLSGQLSLLFAVKEQAQVTSISFTGCTAFNKNERLQFFSQIARRPKNADLLADAIEKFESAYREKGYLLAHVSSVTEGKAGALQIHVDEWMLGQLVPEPLIAKADKSIESIQWRRLLPPGELQNHYRRLQIIP